MIWGCVGMCLAPECIDILELTAGHLQRINVAKACYPSQKSLLLSRERFFPTLVAFSQSKLAFDPRFLPSLIAPTLYTVLQNSPANRRMTINEGFIQTRSRTVMSTRVGFPRNAFILAMTILASSTVIGFVNASPLPAITSIHPPAFGMDSLAITDSTYLRRGVTLSSMGSSSTATLSRLTDEKIYILLGFSHADAATGNRYENKEFPIDQLRLSDKVQDGQLGRDLVLLQQPYLYPDPMGGEWECFVVAKLQAWTKAKPQKACEVNTPLEHAHSKTTDASSIVFEERDGLPVMRIPREYWKQQNLGLVSMCINPLGRHNRLGLFKSEKVIENNKFLMKGAKWSSWDKEIEKCIVPLM
ncbi:hypothetical protein DFJ43DRAFT_1073077 [Lentinula guzmanii]|uniref:Uncharacterized protein n=1 Tax=Lentinula guzmanii TaxID=2804957 RepID=A0AA38JSX9_9AGAR|nr:hypothetical protein DFJ43DRAFT_1073077 [Lentinula guzmanii]